MEYLLSFYVSESHLNSVKEALFEAGAGAYGGFRNCSWEVLGHGQYQADDEPTVKQPEYKVEMLCLKENLENILKALKQAHPCDEPAFYLLGVRQTTKE